MKLLGSHHKASSLQYYATVDALCDDDRKTRAGSKTVAVRKHCGPSHLELYAGRHIRAIFHVNMPSYSWTNCHGEKSRKKMQINSLT